MRGVLWTPAIPSAAVWTGSRGAAWVPWHTGALCRILCWFLCRTLPFINQYIMKIIERFTGDYCADYNTGLHAGFIQVSVDHSGTRLNSAALWATRGRSRASAWAAIHRSFGPIGWPMAARWAPQPTATAHGLKVHFDNRHRANTDVRVEHGLQSSGTPFLQCQMPLAQLFHRRYEVVSPRAARSEGSLPNPRTAGSKSRCGPHAEWQPCRSRSGTPAAGVPPENARS